MQQTDGVEPERSSFAGREDGATVSLRERVVVREPGRQVAEVMPARGVAPDDAPSIRLVHDRPERAVIGPSNDVDHLAREMRLPMFQRSVERRETTVLEDLQPPERGRGRMDVPDRALGTRRFVCVLQDTDVHRRQRSIDQLDGLQLVVRARRYERANRRRRWSPAARREGEEETENERSARPTPKPTPALRVHAGPLLRRDARFGEQAAAASLAEGERRTRLLAPG
jgi:hypothetical protein